MHRVQTELCDERGREIARLEAELSALRGRTSIHGHFPCPTCGTMARIGEPHFDQRPGADQGHACSGVVSWGAVTTSWATGTDLSEKPGNWGIDGKSTVSALLGRKVGSEPAKSTHSTP